MLELMKIRQRIGAAVHPHPNGSSARVWAARHALQKAYDDGLLASPPEWNGPRDVTVVLRGEVKQIDIKAMVI